MTSLSAKKKMSSIMYRFHFLGLFLFIFNESSLIYNVSGSSPNNSRNKRRRHKKPLWEEICSFAKSCKDTVKGVGGGNKKNSTGGGTGGTTTSPDNSDVDVEEGEDENVFPGVLALQDEVDEDGENYNQGQIRMFEDEEISYLQSRSDRSSSGGRASAISGRLVGFSPPSTPSDSETRSRSETAVKPVPTSPTSKSSNSGRSRSSQINNVMRKNSVVNTNVKGTNTRSQSQFVDHPNYRDREAKECAQLRAMVLQKTVSCPQLPLIPPPLKRPPRLRRSMSSTSSTGLIGGGPIDGGGGASGGGSALSPGSPYSPSSPYSPTVPLGRLGSFGIEKGIKPAATTSFEQKYAPIKSPESTTVGSGSTGANTTVGVSTGFTKSSSSTTLSLSAGKNPVTTASSETMNESHPENRSQSTPASTSRARGSTGSLFELPILSTGATWLSSTTKKLSLTSLTSSNSGEEHEHEGKEETKKRHRAHLGETHPRIRQLAMSPLHRILSPIASAVVTPTNQEYALFWFAVADFLPHIGGGPNGMSPGGLFGGRGMYDGKEYTVKDAFVRSLEYDENGVKSSEAWNKLGELGGGFVNGKYVDRVQCFENCLDRDMCNGGCWISLGKALGEEGMEGANESGRWNRWDARECLQNAVKYDKNNAKAWFELGRIQGSGHYTSSQCFAKTLELITKDTKHLKADAWYELGNAGGGSVRFKKPNPNAGRNSITGGANTSGTISGGGNIGNPDSNRKNPEQIPLFHTESRHFSKPECYCQALDQCQADQKAQEHAPLGAILIPDREWYPRAWLLLGMCIGSRRAAFGTPGKEEMYCPRKCFQNCLSNSGKGFNKSTKSSKGKDKSIRGGDTGANTGTNTATKNTAVDTAIPAWYQLALLGGGTIKDVYHTERNCYENILELDFNDAQGWYNLWRSNGGIVGNVFYDKSECRRKYEELSRGRFRSDYFGMVGDGYCARPKSRKNGN